MLHLLVGEMECLVNQLEKDLVVVRLHMIMDLLGGVVGDLEDILVVLIHLLVFLLVPVVEVQAVQDRMELMV